MIIDHENGVSVQFKCDDCGQFIPFDDILAGVATHTLVSEDTLFSSERFDTLCKVCKQAPYNK